MSDSNFLKVNRDITRCFVDLVFKEDPDLQSRSPEERERVKTYIERHRADQTPEDISKQVIMIYSTLLQLNYDIYIYIYIYIYI